MNHNRNEITVMPLIFFKKIEFKNSSKAHAIHFCCKKVKTLEQKVMKNQTASIIETRACLKITRDKAAKAKYALRLTYDEQSEKDAKSPNDDGYALIKAVDRIEYLLNIFSALMNTHLFIANL